MPPVYKLLYICILDNMPTIPPNPPTQINQNSIEYNQMVNNFLDNLEYNAFLAKNSNVDQMNLLYISTLNIINTYKSMADTFCVYDSNLLAIFRPYYVNFNIIGMIKAVGDIDLSHIHNFSIQTPPPTQSEYFNAWCEFLEALQNSKYGF